MKLLGWTATILVICLLAWAIATADVIWIRAFCALALAAFGTLAGLRIATQSTAAYINDLQRTNKILCDQQRELEEINEILLRQVNVEAEVESASPSNQG